MIHLFCLYNLYILHEKYINYLLGNYSFLKLIIINIEDELYKYIIDNKLLYSNNILISEINESLLKIISTINPNNNFYILNTKKFNDNDNISYLSKYSVQILDNNILNYNKFIYFPYIINDDMIYNYDKIYDIAIISNKKDIIQKLKTNNIDIIDITNEIICDNLFKYKIIININDDNNYLLKKNMYDYCILNKILIINSKNINYYNHHTYLDNYVLNIQYNVIPIFIMFILKNYNTIHNFIFNNFKIETIKKDMLKITDNVFYNIQKKDNFGFIIIRHVNSVETNNYWINSYKSIRKYYDNKIIIIDDNSNYDYIKYDSNTLNICNCEIIQSEYHRRGEILGYYYFYKYHFFSKAVIIHDSVFINKYIDFDKYTDIKFIWHFTNAWFEQETESNLLNNLNNNKIIKELYNNKDKIHGSFGVQSVITYDFLKNIVNKYNLFNLINYIDNRIERMNFERIFALVCINECNDLSINPSIFGSIHNYIKYGYTYEEYLSDKIQNKIEHLEIIKVWTGR